MPLGLAKRRRRAAEYEITKHSKPNSKASARKLEDTENTQRLIEIAKEEELLNTLMKTNKNMKIIIYGLNSNDETIYTKYYHLQKCGFTRVYIYTGGLFEWLCLQDIYGDDSFATTQSELDILKYKPKSCLNRHTITDYPHNL